MTDELGRLRAQLSSLQSLLILSKLMGDSGDELRIIELAGTAARSPRRRWRRAGWAYPMQSAAGHVGFLVWPRRPTRRPRNGSCCSRSPSRPAWR